MLLITDLETLFPLQGPLREILLLFDIFIIFISLELGTILLIRDYKKKNEPGQNRADAVYASLMIAWGLFSVMNLLGNYYASNLESRYLYMYAGAFFLDIALTIFAYFVDKWKSKKAGFSTYTMIGIVIVFTLIFLIYPSILIYIVFLIFIPILNSFIKHIKLIRANLAIKRGAYQIYIWTYVLILLGFIIGSDLILYLTGLIEMILIGSIIQIIGFIFSIHFFLSIPSSSDLNWENKIEKLFVFYGNGIIIFKHNFVKIANNSKIEDSGKSDELDDAKIMAVYGMKEFLKQTMSSSANSSISKIQQEDEYITLKYGKYITGVVVSFEDSFVLDKLLDKFVERLELLYQNILPNWKGDLAQLASIEIISKEFFPITSKRD